MTDRTEWRSPETTDLFEAVLTLNGVSECESFFRDLCTLHEIDELSRRWQIVRLLDAGLPYREIAERTGSSTATITRINQWLRHGAGGYRLVLRRTSSEGGR